TLAVDVEDAGLPVLERQDRLLREETLRLHLAEPADGSQDVGAASGLALLDEEQATLEDDAEGALQLPARPLERTAAKGGQGSLVDGREVPGKDALMELIALELARSLLAAQGLAGAGGV